MASESSGSTEDEPRLLFFGTVGPAMSAESSMRAFECIRFQANCNIAFFTIIPAGEDAFSRADLAMHKGQTNPPRFDMTLSILTTKNDDIQTFNYSYGAEVGTQRFDVGLSNCRYFVMQGNFNAVTVAIYGYTEAEVQKVSTRRQSSEDYVYLHPTIDEEDETPPPNMESIQHLLEASRTDATITWPCNDFKVYYESLLKSSKLSMDEVLQPEVDLKLDDVVEQIRTVSPDTLLKTLETSSSSLNELPIGHCKSQPIIEHLQPVLKAISQRQYGSISLSTRVAYLKATGAVCRHSHQPSTLLDLGIALEQSTNSSERLSILQALLTSIEHPLNLQFLYIDKSHFILTTQILPILKTPNLRPDIKDTIRQIVDICDIYQTACDMRQPTLRHSSLDILNYHLERSLHSSSVQHLQMHRILAQIFTHPPPSDHELTPIILSDIFANATDSSLASSLINFAVLLSQSREGLSCLSQALCRSDTFVAPCQKIEIGIADLFKSSMIDSITSRYSPPPYVTKADTSADDIRGLLSELVKAHLLVSLFVALPSDASTDAGPILKALWAIRRVGATASGRQAVSNAFIVLHKADVLIELCDKSPSARIVLQWLLHDMRSYTAIPSYRLIRMCNVYKEDSAVAAHLETMMVYHNQGTDGLLDLLREQRDVPQCLLDIAMIIKLRSATAILHHQALNADGLAKVLRYETADYGTADFGNCLSVHLLRMVEDIAEAIASYDSAMTEVPVSNSQQRRHELVMTAKTMLALSQHIVAEMYGFPEEPLSQRHFEHSSIQEFETSRLMPSRRKPMMRSVVRSILKLICALDADRDADVVIASQQYINMLATVKMRDNTPQTCFFSEHAITLIVSEVVKMSSESRLQTASIFRVWLNSLPMQDTSSEGRLVATLNAKQIQPLAMELLQLMTVWIKSSALEVRELLAEVIRRLIWLDSTNDGVVSLLVMETVAMIQDFYAALSKEETTTAAKEDAKTDLYAGFLLLNMTLSANATDSSYLADEAVSSLLSIMSALLPTTLSSSDDDFALLKSAIPSMLEELQAVEPSSLYDANTLARRFLPRLSRTDSDGMLLPMTPGSGSMLSPLAASFGQYRQFESGVKKNLGGGKSYQRNEFRSIHGNRKANTSRPPSVHVDDFSVGNIPQNQQHPETPIDVQTLAARRQEQEAAIAAAVAKQQRLAEIAPTLIGPPPSNLQNPRPLNGYPSAPVRGPQMYGRDWQWDGSNSSAS